jgi:DUF971 family protein
MPTPVDIYLNSPLKQLEIQWNNGHHSTYFYIYLRGFCPCAVCQHHQAKRRFVHVDEADCVLKDVAPVGHYALNLIWRQHKTGIYTHDWLFNLCPCSSCLKNTQHPAQILTEDERLHWLPAQATK